MKQKKPVRIEVIRIKLATMADCVELVKEHLPSNVEEFVNLGLVKDGIYKRIEYAIENVIDICAMINADLNLGIPESEDDIISSLVNNGIIEYSLSDEIRQMKRFRNIVVHQYGKIDDLIAYEILTERLSSFTQFKEIMNLYLDQE
jgi:uncharacterized protein YutE (UPF0331/DUF86 family)